MDDVERRLNTFIFSFSQAVTGPLSGINGPPAANRNGVSTPPMEGGDYEMDGWEI